MKHLLLLFLFNLLLVNGALAAPFTIKKFLSSGSASDLDANSRILIAQNYSVSQEEVFVDGSLVGYKCKYPTVPTALKNSDGKPIAVVLNKVSYNLGPGLQCPSGYEVYSSCGTETRVPVSPNSIAAYVTYYQALGCWIK